MCWLEACGIRVRPPLDGIGAAGLPKALACALGTLAVLLILRSVGGALPGISPSIAMALLLPVTYPMAPNPAILIRMPGINPADARGAALGHPRPGGASIIGLGPERRADAFRAGHADATAIREPDLTDSFFAQDSRHPGDVTDPIAAIAEARGLTGAALLRGIVTAFAVQVRLVKGIALNRHRVDHVAHLGPDVAAGIGAMLGLPAPAL